MSYPEEVRLRQVITDLARPIANFEQRRGHERFERRRRGSRWSRSSQQDSMSHRKSSRSLMTGTQDVARIGGGTVGAATVETRLAVYPALPPGSKYELVLDGAEHSAFTDRPLPGESGPRNPNHHRVILAFSTAFWDAFLKGDPEARAWLDGADPRSILDEKDRSQRK
jgi:hypothetical protein